MTNVTTGHTDVEEVGELLEELLDRRGLHDRPALVPRDRDVRVMLLHGNQQRYRHVICMKLIND